jgi:hypothetical protein
MVYFRIREDVAPRNRIWWLIAAAALLIFFMRRKPSTKKRAPEHVRLEVSDQKVIFHGNNGRTEIPWSGFANCLESPTLFVLITRSKVLYSILKSAFPNEESRDWFGRIARTELSAPPPIFHTPPQTAISGGLPLAITIQFRDLLHGSLTSWRFKGIATFVYLITIGSCISIGAQPTLPGQNSPLRVLLIMIPAITAMLLLVLLLQSYVAWRISISNPIHRIVLKDEGMEFVEGDTSGQVSWDVYSYFLETRRAFFMWNPKTSRWFMVPKHTFASLTEEAQCRALLQTHLKPSHWFFM